MENSKDDESIQKDVKDEKSIEKTDKDKNEIGKLTAGASQQCMASIYCPYCGSRVNFRYSQDDKKKLKVICNHCNGKIKGLMDLGI